MEGLHTTGHYSIFMKVMTRSIDELQTVLIHKIQTIDEIQSTETLISLQNPILRDVKPWSGWSEGALRSSPVRGPCPRSREFDPVGYDTLTGGSGFDIGDAVFVVGALGQPSRFMCSNSGIIGGHQGQGVGIGQGTGPGIEVGAGLEGFWQVVEACLPVPPLLSG